MPASHLEIERKYTLSAGAQLPDLSASGLADIASVDTREDELDADYFDTGDLSLLGQRVTLRRREGGPDAGWHLKLPDSNSAHRRHEIQLPLQAEIPDEIKRYVSGLTHSRALMNVARITTHRTVHLLHDSTGRTLAEVAVDAVTARDHLGSRDVAWNEVEAELVDGDEQLLDDIDAALTAAGLREADFPSKLAHVLGRDQPARAQRPKHPTAADVIGGYLRDHLDALLAADLRLRTDPDDEAVHDLRVAARRLRSCLTTYKSLVDRDTKHVCDELRWIGVSLGRERDDQVLLARLEGELDDEQPGKASASARALIDRWMGSEIAAAHDDSTLTLASDRYLNALEQLAQLIDSRAYADVAAGPAARVLLPLAERDWKRLQKRRKKWKRAESQAQDEALHAVRKAAKRARYAVEVLEAPGVRVKQPRVRAAGAQLANMQDVLGLHHDLVVARSILRDLAARRGTTLESAFVLGRLHHEAQVDAEQAVRDFASSWKRVESTMHVALAD